MLGPPAALSFLPVVAAMVALLWDTVGVCAEMLVPFHTRRFARLRTGAYRDPTSSPDGGRACFVRVRVRVRARTRMLCALV